jgi:hypothetical protein
MGFLLLAVCIAAFVAWAMIWEYNSNMALVFLALSSLTGLAFIGRMILWALS